eukprot:scaffold203233_cov21-Tisochrysis_lutea.AAC.1
MPLLWKKSVLPPKEPHLHHLVHEMLLFVWTCSRAGLACSSPAQQYYSIGVRDRAGQDFTQCALQRSLTCAIAQRFLTCAT